MKVSSLYSRSFERADVQMSEESPDTLKCQSSIFEVVRHCGIDVGSGSRDEARPGYNQYVQLE